MLEGGAVTGAAETYGFQNWVLLAQLSNLKMHLLGNNAKDGLDGITSLDRLRDTLLGPASQGGNGPVRF